MKLLSLISITALFLFALFGCKDWKKGKFKITNHTKVQIDSLYIEPNKIREFASVKSGETIPYLTNMADEKNDGMHRLAYSSAGKHLFRSLCYYSNGNFIEKEIEIHIYPDDSIFIKPIYKNN